MFAKKKPNDWPETVTTNQLMDKLEEVSAKLDDVRLLLQATGNPKRLVKKQGGGSGKHSVPILVFLRENKGQVLSVYQIAKAVGIDNLKVAGSLASLARSGKVKRVAQGNYKL